MSKSKMLKDKTTREILAFFPAAVRYEHNFQLTRHSAEYVLYRCIGAYPRYDRYCTLGHKGLGRNQ